ncbi:MAG: primosomal protein N', partial [Promicromonosporaceae bacterium]|nr:primosomal protein N' [Promicromonosporaceae bacterium]
LTPKVLRLVKAVAGRWAGTTADVLRLAVPPRHARTELEPALTPAHLPAVRPAPDAWSHLWAPYRGGEAFSRHLLSGEVPKAVWTPLPGLAPPVPTTDRGVPHWAAAVAMVTRVAVAAERGVLIVAPDIRDVGLIEAALATAGVSNVVRLSAQDGPAPRYRAFLSAVRGQAQVVVGTRAAMFAPVKNLGLIVLWGDGEDPLAEPHAPYPNARDVLALRSSLEHSAYLLGSPGRTVQAQSLVSYGGDGAGWAHEIVAPRDVIRQRAPRVRALTSTELAAEGPGAVARIPTAAWRAVRDALNQGPVLVQVPRAGYLPAVACARCRAMATCQQCHGPLGLGEAGSQAQCQWCGRLAGGWRCACGSTAFRAIRVGSERTAEELGRAFPGVPVRVSTATSAHGVIDRVPARPSLVIATPGAEPLAEGGYVAALLLDAAATTAATGLDAGTRALHRWLVAAHLVRPATASGQVLLVGDAAPGPTSALVRFDPGGFAARELAERTELHLPPAVRVAAVTGERTAVMTLLSRVPLATPQTILGPVELPEESRAEHAQLFTEIEVRAVVRVPIGSGTELARQLRASLAVRSAHREPGAVRVQLDPAELV